MGCYESKGRCEHEHRRLSGASEDKNSTFEGEANLGTCNPDPHCSWDGDRCHCCYNGGCDYEEACKCGHAPPQPICSPDPHCIREGEQCKCCFNGGCDFEDMCKCGGAVISNSYSGGSDSGVHEDSAELNSTGMMEALANWWCEPVGGVCGGPWKWPKKCCGNAKCQKLLGGDGTMKCVEEHPEQQCVPIHGECGGPGRRTETCCHGKCESPSFVGGNGIMKCVDKQCAAQHAECGGPGRQTLPCCAPELSCKSPFGSAVMKCM